MERMDEVRLIEALQTIAEAFALDSDVARIASALEKLSECVLEDANGVAYFNISPEVE